MAENKKSDGPGMKGWQQGRSGEFGVAEATDQVKKSSTSIDSKFYSPRSSEFKVDVNPGTGMSK